MNSTSTVITGFEAYGSLRENPSAILVRSLADLSGAAVKAVVLPTSYARTNALVVELLKPPTSAMLMFGHSYQTDRLRLEYLARNRDGSRHVDNDGMLGSDPIVDGGPHELLTTVDMVDMLTNLTNARVPFSFSVDAGDYVCNHAYYLAQRIAIERSIPCLFAHVPATTTNEDWALLMKGALVLLRHVANCGNVAKPA